MRSCFLTMSTVWLKETLIKIQKEKEEIPHPDSGQRTDSTNDTIRASDALLKNGTEEVVMSHKCSVLLWNVLLVIKNICFFSLRVKNTLFLFQNVFSPNSVSRHSYVFKYYQKNKTFKVFHILKNEPSARREKCSLSWKSTKEVSFYVSILIFFMFYGMLT